MMIKLTVSDGTNSRQWMKVAKNADEALAAAFSGWDPFTWTKEEQEDYTSDCRFVG
jgi:hypothetical protein